MKKIDPIIFRLTLVCIILLGGCSVISSGVEGPQRAGLPFAREEVFSERDRLIERVELLREQAAEEGLDIRRKEALEREIEFLQQREIPALTSLLLADESIGDEEASRQALTKLAGDYYRYLADSADYRQALLKQQPASPPPAAATLTEQDNAELFARTIDSIAAASERILLLTEVGLYAQAVGLYEALAEDTPQALIPQSAVAAAGRAYLGIGRVVQAAQLYRSLGEGQGGGRAELALLIGERYLARHESDRALEYFGLSAQLADAAAAGGKVARKRIESASAAGGYGSSEDIYELAQARLNLALGINFGRTREICSTIAERSGRNNLAFEAKNLSEQNERAEKLYVERLLAIVKGENPAAERAKSAIAALNAYLSDQPQSRYRAQIESAIGDNGGDDVPAAKLIDDARRLTAAGKYPEAIVLYRKAMQAPGATAALAEEKLRETVDLYAGIQRQKAAEVFLQARRTTDERRKAQLLLSIESMLLDLVNNYGETKLTGKIKVNLTAVQDALKPIDPQLLQELRTEQTADE